MTPAPCAIHAPLPLTAGVDLDRLLAAIAQVERVRGSHRRGSHGERGKYQMRREAWDEDAGGLPFAYAENDAYSDIVARARLVRLRYELLERRLEPSAYNLALCWNGGEGGAVRVILKKWSPPEMRDYAERVSALYRSP